MPGLLRGVARTAVIAGTATAVSNRVSRRQANRWSQQEQQQYEQQQCATAVRPTAPQPVPRLRRPKTRWTTSSASSRSSATLKDQGILTEAEFDAQKAKILAGRCVDLDTQPRAVDVGERGVHRRARGIGVGRARDHVGLFEVPEREIGALGDVAGLDVVELGCGTAYFSGVARAPCAPGAVDVDLTPAQLETARRCQQEFGVDFPLVEADGVVAAVRRRELRPRRERVRRERVVRPAALDPRGGAAAAPGRPARVPHEQRARDAVRTRGRGRDRGTAAAPATRPAPGASGPVAAIEFHPGHGDWIRILRANGFEIEALHECTHRPRGTPTTTASRRRVGGSGRSKISGSRVSPAGVSRFSPIEP